MIGYCENLMIPKEFPFRADTTILNDNYFMRNVVKLGSRLFQNVKSFPEINFDDEGNIISNSESQMDANIKKNTLLLGEHIKTRDCDFPAETYCHWHHYIEITYGVSGHGWYYSNGTEIEMRRGDMIIFNILTPHAWKPDLDDPLTVKCFYFSPKIIFSGSMNLNEPCIDSIFGDAYSCIVLSDTNLQSNTLANILLLMEKENKDKLPGYKLMIQSKLLEFTACLHRFYMAGRTDIPDNKFNRLYKDALIRVLSFVEDNYYREITLNDAARVACMSPSYFSSFFSKTMNIPFINYLAQYRVSCAAKLLLTTDTSVIDIANECGFSSLSSFYRSFKNTLNVSPNSYRKKVKSESV